MLNLILDLQYFLLVLIVIHLISGNWSLLILSDDYICPCMPHHDDHFTWLV